jgi:beta-1,4-mannosyl-glycoprotein beta-1,4-N-acetylglucosaminyltransferase
MTRPLIIDTFSFNNEMAMLTCRLEEMADGIDYMIAVEADVDHQNHPKPYHLSENLEQFSAWSDKLIVVRATDLPTNDHAGDPWCRELAQRDWVRQGLCQVPNLDETAIILHGDVDEICTPLHTRNVRPKPGQLISFDQRLHCFAVDWLHPDPWRGTVAGVLGSVMRLGPDPFARMRDTRNTNPHMPDAGWHLSWLGGRDAALAKLGSFCHPEIADRTLMGLQNDQFLQEGFHVDGRRMAPVDVDETWPRFVFERRCPDNWFRPR